MIEHWCSGPAKGGEALTADLLQHITTGAQRFFALWAYVTAYEVLDSVVRAMTWRCNDFIFCGDLLPYRLRARKGLRLIKVAVRLPSLGGVLNP